MSVLETNLRVLAAADAPRAAAIGCAAPLGTVERAATGEATLVVDGLPLHSRHDPRAEARTWAASQREALERAGSSTAVVLGLGLGYHVEALAASWAGRIVVVEPDDGLLRTALASRDLTDLLERVDLAAPPLTPAWLDALGAASVLPHGPSVLRAGQGLRAVAERVQARAVLATTRLRILVVSPLAGGSHPIAGYAARALAELGHAVTLLDLAPFAAGFEAISTFTPRRSAQRGVETAYTRFLGAGVLAALDATRADVVLGLAQAPLSREVLAEIGRRGAIRAFWFVEDHRLFSYWRDVVPEYDYLFTIQEGPVLEEATGLGVGLARYLPCAADPSVHRPLVLGPREQAELGAPVGFVGAGYRNRRLAFRGLLDQGLRIWGTEWAGAGPVETAVQRDGARLTPEECVRVFNATDVNLNLHSSTYVDGVEPRGDFVNPRTFELAASGAFQLVDARSLLPPLLHPGTEVATFTDVEHLPERVAYYLAHPDERRALAVAGRTRVLAEHTYRHRMQRLLETIAGRDAERLRATAREETVAEAARAEGDTPLGRLLAEMSPTTPFTLDGVVGSLLGRTGRLTEPEAILLFLHQFDELYVREHRA